MSKSHKINSKIIILILKLLKFAFYYYIKFCVCVCKRMYIYIIFFFRNIYIYRVCVWISSLRFQAAFCSFFFFSRVLEYWDYCSINSNCKCWLSVMNSVYMHCLWTHKFHFLSIFSLKMGPTSLFTHLKIILLQCFQYSVFNFNKISSIQTHPESIKPNIEVWTNVNNFSNIPLLLKLINKQKIVKCLAWCFVYVLARAIIGL